MSNILSMSAAEFVDMVNDPDIITDRPRETSFKNDVVVYLVRSRAPDGFILQGCALTSEEAWDDWRDQEAKHREQK